MLIAPTKKINHSTFLADRFPEYEKLLAADTRAYKRSIAQRRFILVAAFIAGVYLGSGI